MSGIHEDIGRHHDVAQGSERSFGLVFAAVFGVVALWPLLHAGTVRWWAVVLAAVFVVVALAVPRLLKLPNRWWLAFGLLLGRIVSPLALGILFYLVFAPMGWFMRRGGYDPLRLARDETTNTYWRSRQPPGPPPESLTNQF